MRRTAIFIIAAATLAAPPLPDAAYAARRSSCPRYGSLDLAVDGNGIGFGNSKRLNGLRFNLVDCGIEEINGVNVTLWKPESSPDGIVRGISLGLLGPRAGELVGISIGGLFVVGESRLTGISLAGLASVSEGEQSGISVAGLAAVAKGAFAGIQLAGLAAVSEQDLSGIAVGGLAAVAEGDASGILIGGLAAVAEGDHSGISIGGLAAVAEGALSGISLAGLAAVGQDAISGIAISAGGVASEGDIAGISAGGIGIVDFEGSKHDGGIDIGFKLSGIRGENIRWLAVHGIDIHARKRLEGLGIAGIDVRANEIAGAAIGGIVVKAEDLTGFSASTVNWVDGMQAGLSIGLVNYARELRGLQLGLVNVARNNRPGLRVLPVLNAHF